MPDLRNSLEELLIRVAASGLLPAKWFLTPPAPESLPARTGTLAIEIVSHCWNYSHLLAYQLSSLVTFPPGNATVRMTVFHSPEDVRTASLLAYFTGVEVPGVTWNWQPVDRGDLFRRAIGRNRVARQTRADWVWFTDCDILFGQDCLDGLARQLQGRRDRLTYPREERVTAMLREDDALLAGDRSRVGIVEFDPALFEYLAVPRATGAYQIVHGDVARACGYCEQLGLFQRPANRWAKTYEDRAFRWLMNSQGVPLDVPSVYRIRHLQKGRYGDNRREAQVRSTIRRVKAFLQSR